MTGLVGPDSDGTALVSLSAPVLSVDLPLVTRLGVPALLSPLERRLVEGLVVCGLSGRS